MERSDSKLVKRLAKSLIWAIVSLEVFACGFAAIVLCFSKNWLVNVFDLIYYLAFLPLIGFIIFIVSIIFLWIVKIICSSSKKAIEETQKPPKNINSIKEIVEKIKKLLEEIHEQLSKTDSEPK